MGKLKLLMVVIAFVMAPALVFCEAIDWKEYDKGVSLAKQEKKKIFLHFKTQWCPACRKLERTTFKDSDIIQFLNKYFINIKVDGDKQRGLLKKYKVRGYPDNLFLNKDAKLVYRRVGALDPMTFHFFLEYVQTESYKTMTPMEYFHSR